MNTQKPVIPSIARTAGDDPAPIASTLIERLAASHAAVLEKWQLKFSLDLRRSQIASMPSSPLRTD